MLCEHCHGDATDFVLICGSVHFYCDLCLAELNDFLELRFNRGLEP